MKIAICDDEQRDIDLLERYIGSHEKTHEVTAFLSVHDFLARLQAGESFDLLFLDVQMPDADGWAIAKHLKQTERRLFIAMVTIHGEHIFDCFDRVDWFAPKPVSEERIWQILDKAEEKLYPVVFEIQTGGVSLPLTAAEVLYFEVQRNDLYIHTPKKVHKTRMTLKSVKKMIGTLPQFVQVHGSYIINLDHYERLSGDSLLLKNGERIKLSRGYRDAFFAALDDYVRDV